MAEQIRNTPLGELVPEGHVSKLPAWALKLTERKLRFVQEYIVDRNGREAVLRAGLTQSKSSAKEMATNMLRDGAVRAALDELWSGEVSARLALRDRIMEELSIVAFADIGNVISVKGNTVTVKDLDSLTEETRRSIASIQRSTGKTITIKVEMHDKLKALDLLDQMNGAPRTQKTDNTKIGIKDSNVQFVVTPEEARAL